MAGSLNFKSTPLPSSLHLAGCEQSCKRRASKAWASCSLKCLKASASPWPQSAAAEHFWLGCNSSGSDTCTASQWGACVKHSRAARGQKSSVVYAHEVQEHAH